MLGEKSEGDLEAGFKQADQILEFDFVLPPYASHIPNPSASMAYWYDDQGASEGKNLWIEGISQGREQISRQNNIPYDKVIEATPVSGRQVLRLGISQEPVDHSVAGQADGAPGEVR